MEGKITTDQGCSLASFVIPMFHSLLFHTARTDNWIHRSMVKPGTSGGLTIVFNGTSSHSRQALIDQASIFGVISVLFSKNGHQFTLLFWEPPVSFPSSQKILRTQHLPLLLFSLKENVAPNIALPAICHLSWWAISLCVFHLLPALDIITQLTLHLLVPRPCKIMSCLDFLQRSSGCPFPNPVGEANSKSWSLNYSTHSSYRS